MVSKTYPNGSKYMLHDNGEQIKHIKDHELKITILCNMEIENDFNYYSVTIAKCRGRDKYN